MTDGTDRFLVCTNQDWGVEAFNNVTCLRPAGTWLCWRQLADSPEQLVVLTKRLKPKMIFFLNWSTIVPVVVHKRYKCVNFHCTPLPYGRGGHPIENMILHGHKRTVIVAHKMTADIDAGPIYGSTNVISLRGDKTTILGRFAWPVAKLVVHIASSDLTPSPQRGKVVIFKRLSPTAYKRFWEARGR